MKLHLPSGLRKALLACLSALAFPAATLASGSGLFAPGALVAFALSGGAVAAWVTPDVFPDDGEYTTITGNNINLDSQSGDLLRGTWGGGNVTLNNGAGKNLKMTKSGPNSATNLKGSITVSNLWLHSEVPDWGNNDYNHFDIAANFLTSSIQNIYIDHVGAKFSGAQTGLEAHIHIGPSSTPNGNNKGYTGLNTGDWKNINVWLNEGCNVETTGDLHIVDDVSIVFNNAHFKASSLQGDGNLKIGGGANATSYMEITNGGQLAGTLEFGTVSGVTRSHEFRFGGTLSLNGVEGSTGTFSGLNNASTLSITGTGSEASHITFSGVKLSLDQNASQTFTDSTIQGGGISLASDSTLSLRGSSTADGVLTLNGNATLSLDESSAASASFSGVSGSGVLTLDLGSYELETGSYQLFQTWNTEEVELQLGREKNGRRTFSFANGELTVTYTAGNLVWTLGNFTWIDESSAFEQNGASTGWQDVGGRGDYFCNQDHVTFNAAAGGTVTLGSDITTGNMTIADGTWTFAGDTHTLAVKTLALGDKTVTMNNGTFSIAQLKGSGTLNYWGANLLITDAAGFTGTLNLTRDTTLSSDLALGEGGKIVVDRHSFTLNNQSTLDSDLEFTASANSSLQLQINQGASFTGNVVIHNSTYISVASAQNTATYSSFGAEGKFIELRADDGEVAFYNGTTDSPAYIYSAFKGLKTLKMQGGGFIHLTADLDGAENSASLTFANRGSGTYGGNIYVDGKVSNVTSITNSLYRHKETNNRDGQLWFTGEVNIGASGLTLTSTSADDIIYLQGALTGNGSITKAGSGDVNIEEGADLSDFSGGLVLSAGTVNVNSDARFAGVQVSAGTLHVAEGKNLTLVKGGQLNLTGGTTTFDENAVLHVQVIQDHYGNDTGISDQSLLTQASLDTVLGSADDETNGIDIILDWDLAAEESSLYLIDAASLTEEQKRDLLGKITIAGAEGATLSIDDSGWLQVTSESYNLVWTSGDGTWSTSNENSHWKANGEFQNDFFNSPDIIFGEDATSSGTIVLQGELLSHGDPPTWYIDSLNAKNLVVKGQFIFDFGEEDPQAHQSSAVYVGEDLTIMSGAKLTLIQHDRGDASLTVIRNIVLNGTLQVDSPYITVSTYSDGITGTDPNALFIVNYAPDTDAQANLDGVTFNNYAGSVQINQGTFNLAENLNGIGGKIIVSNTGSLRVGANTDKTLDLARTEAGAALTLNAGGVTLGGAINLLEDTTINGHADGATTLNGAVSGNGHALTLTDGSFTVGATGSVSGVTTLTLGAGVTFTTANESGARIEALSGEGTVAGAALTISNGSGATSSAVINADLVKSGAGRQTLSGNIENSSITVNGGTLALSGSRVVSGNISVSRGATLESAKDWATGNTANTTLTLNNGTFKNTKTSVDGQAVALGMGTLSVGSGGGTIAWADGDNATGQQQMSFTRLTGAGDLTVNEMKRTSNQRYQRLVINEIYNYNGTLNVSVAEGNASGYGTGGLYIGSARQTLGNNAVIHGIATVRNSTNFTKSGGGTLHIDTLKVYTGSILSVSYSGGLFSVDTLDLRANAVLKYDFSLSGLLTWDATALDALNGGKLTLDLGDEQALVSEKWYDLGITDKNGTHADLDALKTKFSLQNIQADYSLLWRDGRLHLMLGEFDPTEKQWDANWGDVAEIGPDVGTMLGHIYEGGEDLVLSNTTHDDGTYNIVRITGGGEGEGMIIGGARYTQESDIDTLERSTWISMLVAEGDTAQYHILVGGSSCEATAGDPTEEQTAAGGFLGNSHIQMKGGEVDYIVGGNHVTNSAFTFTGSSWISIMPGSVVNGGIVGGSTLTKGSANDNDIYEFGGSQDAASHIYIYEALAGADAPGIKLGDGGTGAAFTAVVGGNAWVELPSGGAAGMGPSFFADSNITINLHDATTHIFDKDIVGGNYTAFTGEGNADRSTTFTGTARISITANSQDVFTGGINGASRRASGGGGETLFSGDTYVTINGGTYQNIVAGGMWFEGSASGDHTSQLLNDGHTNVTINSGNMWRVVGGSVSLQGGAAAHETQEGDSRVVINGGSFTSKGLNSQTEIGFVSGGDFYRNNSGDHSHNGNASVVVHAGSFSGVHIVGGDYANASTPTGEAQNTMSTRISGTSSVTLGGAESTGALNVRGLVVGGSYLTDSGAGGTVEVGSTAVSIGDRAVLDSHDGHTMHEGLAVVGGHVVIDENATSKTTSGGHEAIVDTKTTLTVSGTAKITGDVVGGSYANRAMGTNTLSSETIEININGGMITGNVYGGHYTESVNSPDTLSTGAITIRLTGGEVTGNIVGGGRRATVNDEAGSSNQGAITVSLTGGKLTGNVYAAGYNAGTGTGSALTMTVSTKVSIGAGVVFAAGEPDALTTPGTIIISGGYGRADVGVARGTITGDAVLEITEANASIAANADKITFANFSVADVAADADTAVSTKLYVLRRQGQTGAEQSFTKRGAGKLSVDGLTMWTAADDGSLRADGYSGQITLTGGVLELTGADDQSLAGGLSYDLSTLGKNKATTTYLQATGSGKLTVGADPVGVEITADDTLGVGFYFLAAGLEDNLSVDQFELLNVENLNEKYSYELLLRDNRLILAVLDGENSDRWVWWGKDSNEWREDDNESWNQNADTPHGQDVIFNGHGAEGVTIIGSVSPRSVWVQNGEYEFTGENGGLALGELGTELANERYEGELAVGYGEEEGSHDAALKLSLKNTSIGQVTLLSNGILTLAHAEALPEATKIVFSGGVLGYDAAAEKHADISSRITTEGDGSIIRIRVGDTGLVRAAADELSITWGSADTTPDANSGIASAVNDGIEKTGTGSLTLEWKDNGAEHTGTPTVKEGTLVYRVGATGASKFSGTAVVDAGAKLTIAHAKGATQGSIEVANSLTGEGTVCIGQGDEKGAYTLSGDNSALAGTLELVGDSTGAGAVTVAGAHALGGADTTLALNGRDVVFADGTPAEVAVKEIHVEGGSTSNIGAGKPDAANQSIHLAATRVTGSGALINGAGGFAHTLEGDLSEFDGTITAGAGSSWTLGTSGEVKATLSGEGNIIFAGAEDTLLTGKATDKVSLQNSGTGLVTLASENTGSGSLSGNFNLGTADARATWAGTSLAEDSTLTLVNGSLTGQGGLLSKGAGSQLIVDAAEGATVNAGGTSGSLFDAITINARGHLEGVSGSIVAGNGEGQTKMTLVVDKTNLTPGDGDSMITFVGNGGTLTVADPSGEGFVLDFSTDAIVETIKTSMAGNSLVWLNLVENGELNISQNMYNKLMAKDEDSNLNLLEALGFHVQQVQGGAIALSGSTHEVYMVTADEHSDLHTVTEYGVLSSYKATVVDENQTLTLKLKEAPTKDNALDYEVGGALVNNLIGLEGSQLDVVNERPDGGRVKLALDNSVRTITEEHPEYPELKGVDTTFKGSITGNDGVDVEKLGDGVLTIGSAGNGQSGLKLSDGDLKISAGGIVLQGAENTMGSLTLAYTKDGGQGLTLRGGETRIGSIYAEGEYTDAAGEAHMGGSISLEQGAHLKLTGASEVIDTIIRGDGRLTIDSGAELTMASVGARVSQLSGVSVDVQSGGMLDLSNTQGNTLSSLSGGGALKGHNAGVTLSGSSSFYGTLSGSGSLQITQGASLALDGATASATAQGSGWRIANNGSLSINVAANTEDLWLEALTLGSSSTTTLTINSDGQKGMLAGGTLSVESGAKLIINTTGFNTPEDVLTVAKMDGSNTNISLADVRLGDGVAFTHSQVNKVWFENGELKVSLAAREENMFAVPGQEKNARAGAALLWNLTDHNSEGWQYIVNHPTGDLAMLAEGITKAYHSEDYTGMNKSLAAAAGASTSVLSSALTQDVKRQLNAMRNRSVMTEPGNAAANGDQIQVHAWITAESSFHKLNADGLAPGFKLNGWGGSVGADIDLSDATTVGLAVSAMYSDLTTEAADNARGDMDSAYLSAYSRTTHGAWTHTFAATVGTADVTLNRTVSHELGSYRTNGSTSSEMLGFMYEVGYSIPLNENASTLVQPVFNLQYTYAKVSGYTEGGSDAALKVDGMEQTTLTLGAGARVQSVVGENSFNRVAIVEAHALLKADLGDRSGSATTGFINAGGARCQVESAEVGALGLEIGAGLSIPISEHNGTIFMDASADFRAGYSNMSATAGYRINF